jgi:hypothetical protein
MNRFLMALVIGLTVAGCAEGVEDPQPAPPPDPVQKQPPVQTFSGEFNPINEQGRLGLTDPGPNAPQLPNTVGPVPEPGHE